MAFAMFLAIACQRNELQEDVRPEARSSFKTLTVGVADETGTRVGFDEDNSFYWHGGDRIGVLTVNGFKEMTVGDEYHGQSTGVFTGVVLTGMTSIILFLYEKNKIINKLYNNFSEIYYTLCAIDKNLANFLVTKEITNRNFEINYKLTMEMLNTTKEFDFDEYTSFFDHKFNTILEKALNFNLKLSNLNNITGERAKGILYHELTVKDLELKRLQGFAPPILSSFEQSVINDREAIQ